MSTEPNAFTVDVEDFFHASALDIPQETWGTLDQRAERNTHEILEVLAEANVKATFFVLGWVAEREPRLVRAIAEQGHEIACHGYSHRLIYTQTPAEFRDETRRAKDVLESIVGGSVQGYRAASFSIVSESRWALDVLAELGFTYDSSIFPVRHDRYGIPDADPGPHLIGLGGGASILELPPPVVQVGGLRIPAAGGGYLRLFPYFTTRWAIRRLNASGRPAVVYVHPWEIDVQQPRAKVGLLTALRHYTNIGKMRARMQRLLREFPFETMQVLALHWREKLVRHDPSGRLARPGSELFVAKPQRSTSHS